MHSWTVDTDFDVQEGQTTTSMIKQGIFCLTDDQSIKSVDDTKVLVAFHSLKAPKENSINILQ